MFKTCANKLRHFSTQALKKDVKQTKLGLIGVPFSKGQTKGGVEDAPDLLRQHGLIEILEDTARGKYTYIQAILLTCL